ncbi:MAG: metallophosphoesterase family protein [Chloroflexota bacterium]
MHESKHHPIATIGLISDTHMPARCREFPPALFDLMAGVDLLLHAGDVGELWVLDQLSAIAPVIAVHGNDDTNDAQRELPYQQVITIGGQRILLWHSHFSDRVDEMDARRNDEIVPKFERSIARARRTGANIVVFGHWHVPLVYEDKGVLVINPGAIASGSPFTHQIHKTAAILRLYADQSPQVVHYDLERIEHGMPTPFPIEIDWSAGFLTMLGKVSRSIFAPELQAQLPHIGQYITPLAGDAIRAIGLKLAHRCWAGEIEYVTTEMILDELKDSEQIDDDMKQRIVSLIHS